MDSSEIRHKFLQYFEKLDHKKLPSSSVIPHDDPTLLFINAGMNQFKDFFLGRKKPEYPRVATSQKCIRVGGKHNDLDNVGHTTRHLTFFEMLGNFSFGDYFKEEAIKYAWDLSVNVFEIDPSKIWVTVFETDDESFELWKKWTDEKRIIRMGEKDNYWTMGDTGPRGPCSELLFDRGEEFGTATSPANDLAGERFFEFWNLVFMQENRDQNGIVSKLPNQSIDTGSGLERLVALKKGVSTLFETDVLSYLIEGVELASKKKYDKHDAHHAPAFHVIADHLRSLSFAIADGAQPGNVERGYVLRKVLRRAVRYGRTIGLDKPFLAPLVVRLIEKMGDDFPELKTSQQRITEILTQEEENFIRTLSRGGNILNQVIERANSSANKQISGEDAFKLKDTYGFPIEEVLLIAKDLELEVNLDAYQLLEEKAKELSRAKKTDVKQEVSSELFEDYVKKHQETHFVGYDLLENHSTILAIYKNGEFVDSLKEGEEGSLILQDTPFYAEMGGQVSDTGEIYHHKAHFEVSSTTSPYTGVILHTGKVTKGSFIPGEPINAKIDQERRTLINRNHSATHLLHWALYEVLGAQVKQAGSVVETTKLRFDFSHHKAMTPEEIRNVEQLINDKIRSNHPVKVYEESYDAVSKRADIKQFFGEKYGSKVRVVDIDNFAKELCGGTHVKNLQEIGLFRITKESSISSGIRRIIAVTGKEAEHYMYTREDQLDNMASLLGVPLTKAQTKLESLNEEMSRLRASLKQTRQIHLSQLSKSLINDIEVINNVSVLAKEVEVEKGELAQLANLIMDTKGSVLLLLVTKEEGRCQLLVKVSQDLVKQGFSAKELIKSAATCIGGSGGGRDDNAQAGGKNPEGIEKAIEMFKEVIQSC